MPPKIVLACAGAGKTQRVAALALQASRAGKKTLLLTYTENNQKEIADRLCLLNNGVFPANVVVKGWFTFLLEDMIRPYQRSIFSARISGLFFNPSDPHLANGRRIGGRQERVNGSYNHDYFLTRSNNQAHSAYLSRLATIVLEESNRRPIARLSAIYKTILIDEVQDLVGWDYTILEALSSIDGVCCECVGDFRQTIYKTTPTSRKNPSTTHQKKQAFIRLGFEQEVMDKSKRCVQPICTFADLVHQRDGYVQTRSDATITENFRRHLGVFAVRPADVKEYLLQYKPVILRWDKRAEPELCQNLTAYNFGEAKGSGFDRVLIIPTGDYRTFLSGNLNVFDGNRTETSRNKLYVAITRARYSVAFLYDGVVGFSSVSTWTPNAHI
ncbi:MAG: UvrD-helicase domain-containing protein [Bdellovibrionales bacterium]